MIAGLGVHFLHVRSPYDDALPVVLTHGWPGSVVEFLKVIGPLTDPPAHGGDARDAFHVVCPSPPGYGFSDKPAGRGWDVERIAAAWIELIDNLMFYWLPGTGASAARLYWESFERIRRVFTDEVTDTVAVPAGCSIFPKENPRPSRRWAARRFTDIRHWGEPDRGGHFAAMEQPGLFVEEVRAFFRLVR
ncbi:hypothetical protein GCM10027187_09830 [Streptosporangium sandarakinum]|uniref:Pimeloyl-ACP methyl ester carboxylesterase n=1 Tax=Streptosporangium sandarakinum TaxID=1260955 RepID=A0A852UQ89_9ACTN|nr:pimeloyl-ACP methyl ester carboxylesterase [Streptosporangium sandarakinum]